MNEKIRKFEQASGLEVFGLGARREMWEAAMERFTELIVEECIDILSNDRTFNTCVATTFDKGLAMCVTERSIEKICENFDMKRIYGVPHEGIMGRKVQTK